MKQQNVLEILMYLLENYLQPNHIFTPDYDALMEELHEEGFEADEIDEAFDWLGGLADFQEQVKEHPVNPASFRIYTPDEQAIMDLKCRNLLRFLENIGILTPTTRELVIDRLLHLDREHIDSHLLKWVVLMVLYNQPGENKALAEMERLILDESMGNLH